MNKLFFPAVFHTAENSGFWVSFPDLPECLTQGEDMNNAYEMAADALGLCLSYMEEHGEPVPAPSAPQDILLEDGEFLFVLEFDMLEYKKRTSSKAVKKTLTIPEWLNEAALSMNVNFSQVLQDALMNIVQQ